MEQFVNWKGDLVRNILLKNFQLSLFMQLFTWALQLCIKKWFNLLSGRVMPMLLASSRYKGSHLVLSMMYHSQWCLFSPNEVWSPSTLISPGDNLEDKPWVFYKCEAVQLPHYTGGEGIWLLTQTFSTPPPAPTCTGAWFLWFWSALGLADVAQLFLCFHAIGLNSSSLWSA